MATRSTVSMTRSACEKPPAVRACMYCSENPSLLVTTASNTVLIAGILESAQTDRKDSPAANRSQSSAFVLIVITVGLPLAMPVALLGCGFIHAIIAGFRCAVQRGCGICAKAVG